GEGERSCFERIDVELIGTAPFRCQPCRKADLICIVRKGKLLGYNRAACFKLHGKAGAALPAAMRCGMCAKGTASIKRKRTRHQPVAHFTLCGERERGKPIQIDKPCRNASLSRCAVAQIKRKRTALRACQIIESGLYFARLAVAARGIKRELHPA